LYLPHCPHHGCRNFTVTHGIKWYRKAGFHETKSFGTVPRFRCTACGRTFSTQTFSIDYYAKKVLDYQELMSQLVTGSGMLDIGRYFLIRPETVQNRLERLGRCALGIHADLLKAAPMTEGFAADGFESFSYSQFHPHHINPIVGSRSEFIYAMGFANLRRKGRMTENQKVKRACLETREKADPQAVRKSLTNLCEDLVQHLEKKEVRNTIIVTDEHRQYPKAFGRVKGFTDRLCHVSVSSKRSRNQRNPLFPVNYLDRQFRKDLSDHGRETVQFAHCPAAMMLRMSVYQLFHNCLVHRRVREYKRGLRSTHAEAAGIHKEVMNRIIARHWNRRVFLHKIDLGIEETKTWFGVWRNPAIPSGYRIPYFVAA